MKKIISIIILVLIPLFVYGQWVKSGGPYGYIRTINVQNGGQDVFVGGTGVFRSTDFGVHWTPVNNGLPSQYVSATCFAFKDNDIFLGTINNGIFHSTDYGLHWTRTSLDSQDVLSLVFIGDTMFAGTLSNGIFRSTDLGSTWSVVNSGLTNTDVLILAVDGTTLFAGTRGGGVFQSTDNGDNWVSVNTGLSNMLVLSFTILDTTLYAATSTGVFHFSKNDNTWNAAGLDSIWVWNLASSDTTIYAATSSGLFYSTNSGANWTIIDTLISFGCKALAVNGDYIWTSADIRGLYRSTNKGLSWGATNLLYINVNALVANEQTAFAGTIGHVSISTDCGISWITPLSSGLKEYYWINALTMKGSKLFAGAGNSVYRSTDRGLNWKPVDTGLQSETVRSLITMGENLFAGTDAGVFRSSDDGETWSKLNTGLPANGMVISFTVSDSTIFAGTFWSGVFKLTPNDTVWRSVNTGLTNKRIMALASLGSYVFAGTDGAGMFRLDVGDSIWTAINSGIAGLQVNCLATYGTFLFAGTNYGAVNFTSNNGEQWKSVSEGISRFTFISNLAVCGPYLLAGTDGGLLRRPLSEIITTVSESMGEFPKNYFVSQNYPNPFNSTTTISYHLPKQNHVTLRVFDVLGKEVATLVDELQQAGSRSVEFQAKHLPSGVYFYRLQAGSFIETKKLILLR